MTSQPKLIVPALLLSTALILPACGGAKENLSSEALIQTPLGQVQGVTTEIEGLYNFKGIPLSLIHI